VLASTSYNRAALFGSLASRGFPLARERGDFFALGFALGFAFAFAFAFAPVFVPTFAAAFAVPALPNA
jgi:hypothetical protein